MCKCKDISFTVDAKFVGSLSDVSNINRSRFHSLNDCRSIGELCKLYINILIIKISKFNCRDKTI